MTTVQSPKRGSSRLSVEEGLIRSTAVGAVGHGRNATANVLSGCVCSGDLVAALVAPANTFSVERLAAVLARERRCTRVNALVSIELGPGVERCVAGLAPMATGLAVVVPCVSCKGPMIREHLAAPKDARKPRGFILGVSEVVLEQSTCPLELLAAMPALVRFDPRVERRVPHQISARRKPLAAQSALVSLGRVDRFHLLRRHLPLPRHLVGAVDAADGPLDAVLECSVADLQVRSRGRSGS